jgi:hypothetical protein
MPYLIENGQRRAIPTRAVFYAKRLDPQAVKAVSLQQLEMLPIGQPLSASGVSLFDSGNVFLGAGHYMATHGSLDFGTGQISAWTHIWTITMFGGFHGSVNLILADQYDAPVYGTQEHRYGVDGTWIGTSDRNTPWFENMNPADTNRVTKIYVFHSWSPDSFQTILDRWVAAGNSVSQLATDAANIAKVFSQPATKSS